MTNKVYNIVTLGAHGDGQRVTTNCTIGVGSPVLTVGSGLFVAGDNRKYISVPQAGAFNPNFGDNDPLETRLTYTSSTQVTLDTVAINALSASSQTIEWGNDDAQAFDDFNVAAKAYQAANPADTIELDIPTGRYEIATRITNGGAVFGGIRNLTVIGAGVANTFLSDCGFRTAGGMQFGCVGSTFPLNDPASGNYPGAHVATVFPGATSVRLLTPSENTWFAVGDIVLMSGIDLQGGPAYPQNFQFWEYVTITSITGASSEIINFTPALTNVYKSNWPNGYAGGISQSYSGGPAAMFPMTPEWKNTVSEIRDLTHSQIERQVNYCGKSCTLRRVNELAVAGIIASAQGTFNWIDSDAHLQRMEVDKIVGTCNFTNVTFNQLQFQSPGIAFLNMTGCTLNVMGGTALNTTMTNCTMGQFRPGCSSFGASKTLTVNGGTVGVLQSTGGVTMGNLVNPPYTMVGGTIFVSGGWPAWIVPGGFLQWQSQYTSEVFFEVTDSTISGPNIEVSTNWPNGFPAPFAGSLSGRMHPGPNVNFIGVTGCADVVDLSQAGAQNKPIFSYSKRPYTTLNGNTPDPVTIWGKVVSITVDVIVPTAGAVNLFVTGQFNNYPMIKMSNRTTQSYGPVINLQQPGTRVITPLGVTGRQSGDGSLATLQLPEATSWCTGFMTPFTDGNMAGGSVTIEIVTDHGVVTTPIAAPSLTSRPLIRMR